MQTVMRRAERRVYLYKARLNESSRACSYGGADENIEYQARGIMGEMAFCLWKDLPIPEWHDHPDDGKDVIWCGLRIDVKSAPGPYGRFLIWSRTKNGIFDSKQFDVFVLVKADVPRRTCWIGENCWIGKAAFRRYRSIVDKQMKALGICPPDLGTRFMHEDDLWPRADFESADLAMIARRMKRSSEYLSGQWP